MSLNRFLTIKLLCSLERSIKQRTAFLSDEFRVVDVVDADPVHFRTILPPFTSVSFSEEDTSVGQISES